MDWNAVVIIRTNAKSIAESVTNEIKNEFPYRTSEFYKCTRDLEFILQALSTCIQLDNTQAVDDVIRMFYKGGKLRLKSIDVELIAYDKLKLKLFELLSKNEIKDSTKEIISNCIILLKTSLNSGYIGVEQSWEYRKNYKIFTSDPVPKYLENVIDNILIHCPMQDSKTTEFVILKTTYDDIKLRENLTKHIFKNDASGFHEIAPITAPLVYYCCNKTNPESNSFLNIGLHGGAALAEIRNNGFDFSFIGCTSDNVSNKTEKELIKRIQSRFNLDFDICLPCVAFCIGKANREVNTINVYKCKDGTELRYRTTLEPSVIKPKVLFT
jgi:hypothetical protein